MLALTPGHLQSVFSGWISISVNFSPAEPILTPSIAAGGNIEKVHVRSKSGNEEKFLWDFIFSMMGKIQLHLGLLCSIKNIMHHLRATWKSEEQATALTPSSWATWRLLMLCVCKFDLRFLLNLSALPCWPIFDTKTPQKSFIVEKRSV